MSEVIVIRSETEAREVATQLGIRYDGIQETRQGPRYQFTDTAETGTTFYGNSLREVQENLAAKRWLFKMTPKHRRPWRGPI